MMEHRTVKSNLVEEGHLEEIPAHFFYKLKEFMRKV